MKKLLAILALFAVSVHAATLLPIQLLNPAGSVSGQVATSNGVTSPPSWGAMGYNALPVQIPNSLIGNVSSSTQAPNVVGLPSCASNTNALIYTNGAGFTCNTNINASTLGGQIFSAPGPIGSSVASTGSFTTLGASGLISPTYPAGIAGNKTGSSVTAGSLGEYVCAQVTNSGSPSGCATNSSTPVSLTTVTTANVTSVSLTAGSWLCSGNVGFAPGGTTVTTAEGGWISTASATLATTPNSGAYTFYNGLSSTAGSNVNTFSVGSVRLNFSSTTTVYLEAFSAFTVSTQSALGFLSCLRV